MNTRWNAGAMERLAWLIRLRLGMLPFSDLPDECVCGKRITFDHFLSCHKLKRGPLTMRHDSIANVIAQHARLLGADAMREPRESDGAIPDMLLRWPDREVWVEVSVV